MRSATYCNKHIYTYLPIRECRKVSTFAAPKGTAVCYLTLHISSVMVTIIPLHTTDFRHVCHSDINYAVYLIRQDPIRYIAIFCPLCAVIVHDRKCDLEFQGNDSIFPMPDNLDGDSTIIFSKNTYHMRSVFFAPLPFYY